MTLVVLAAGFLACSEPLPPPIADDIATADGTTAVKTVPVQTVLVEGASDADAPVVPIGVEILTHRISPLHRSFLAGESGLELLGLGLSGLVDSPAQVFVSYNAEEAFGLIALRVPPGTGLVSTVDGGWSLARVPSVFSVLHAFRQHLGANFDLRLASFRIAVQFVRGERTCSLLPADDQLPVGPAACVQVGPDRICGTIRDEVLRVEPADRASLSACFR